MNLKKVKKILLIWVILFIIAYGISAFVTLELDFKKWDILARLAVMWGSFVCCFAIAIWDGTFD